MTFNATVINISCGAKIFDDTNPHILPRETILISSVLSISQALLMIHSLCNLLTIFVNGSEYKPVEYRRTNHLLELSRWIYFFSIWIKHYLKGIQSLWTNNS